MVMRCWRTSPKLPRRAAACVRAPRRSRSRAFPGALDADPSRSMLASWLISRLNMRSTSSVDESILAAEVEVKGPLAQTGLGRNVLDAGDPEPRRAKTLNAASRISSGRGRGPACQRAYSAWVTEWSVVAAAFGVVAGLASRNPASPRPGRRRRNTGLLGVERLSEPGQPLLPLGDDRPGPFVRSSGGIFLPNRRSAPQASTFSQRKSVMSSRAAPIPTHRRWSELRVRGFHSPRG